MPRWLPWILAGFIVFLIGVAPAVYYRAEYAHSKRLRAVVPGQLYRSGQLTAEGFRDAIKELGIKTVVNLQDDFPSPDLKESYFDKTRVKETEVCRELGVRFVFLALDLLPRNRVPAQQPSAIGKMLEVYNDPSNYPMLIHCKAGLHRTGCMAAVYRMEYQGWSAEQAVNEMRSHGFGDNDCTAANDYVYQYVLNYRPVSRASRPAAAARTLR